MEIPTWWRRPGALERFVADLINAEARLLRPGGPWPAAIDPSRLGSTALDESGLGFDSLERLGLAASLSEALHLHRGGLADTLLTAPALNGWVEAARAALARFDGLVTVRSSGSSGTRQSHVHPTARLEAEAAVFAAMLPERLALRSAVASHHIYGMLFTLMLPARLGIPVDDLRSLSAGAVLATLRPGDLVIGHPVFWDLLLQASPSDWPAGVIGVSSGAACPDATATRLIEAGLEGVLDIYGSSETAGIGWRRRGPEGWLDGTGAYRLLSCWQRDANDQLSRDDGVAVVLPDRLHWEASGGFRIGARCDGALMVGGVTVDPAHVRAMLCAHPGVADAAVRLMQPSEGVRLKAFVVPNAPAAEGHAALLASLALHVEGTLTTAERPRAFRFGDRLPVTAVGKPADWQA